MKVVVAGGTGFLGRGVVERLAGRAEVVVLSRRWRASGAVRVVEWHPPAGGAWTEELGTADVVVNLAGANIGEGRWTPRRKRELVESRTGPTELIARALTEAPRRERVLINASAVGFYGDRGEEELDESSAPGSDFLARLVQSWEAAALGARPAARVALLRFGLVLGYGGALDRMIVPFRFFAGGPLGSGRQWMSWVDREDALRAIDWIIDHADLDGPFNVTSPQPVTNAEFARTLGEVLHRPSFLRAPAFALRLAVGEMADPLLLASQRVAPRRLTQAGFSFHHAALGETLGRLLTA
jgi:uncharacterized protein